jgi:hypothetical protein
VEDVIDVPHVTVANGEVFVDGVAVGSVRALAAAEAPQPLPDLTSMLKAKRDLWLTVTGRSAPRQCLLQIDADVTAQVVKSVVAATAAAGFPDIGFMVRPLR